MPATWGRYNAQRLLGASLAAQRRYAEAEPLLVSGYRGLTQMEASIPWESRVALARAQQEILQLYQDWDKPEQAAAWRERVQRENDGHRRER